MLLAQWKSALILRAVIVTTTLSIVGTTFVRVYKSNLSNSLCFFTLRGFFILVVICFEEENTWYPVTQRFYTVIAGRL